MTAEQLWIAAAIVLFILEIITPGFVLANFGVAALAAAISAWLGGDIVVQTGVFVVVCLISFVTIRPLLTRTLQRKSESIPTGVDALIGREASVTEAIGGGLDLGRVQVDGDSWRAIGKNQEPIEKGTVVRILSVDSTTLTVHPI